MSETGYNIPVDQNLFSSILAELNFRSHKRDARTTYHHSDWGVDLDKDEKGWCLSIELIDSEWTIHLFENENLVDSYRCPFKVHSISWDDKSELENQLRIWLTKNGQTLSSPPDIWWALSIGDTKNSHYPFALKKGVAGIDFNILSKKKIGQDFATVDAITWGTFEAYLTHRFDDEQRPTSARNQSIAFLSRIRRGDRLIALKGKSPIWIGRFTDECIDDVQEHETNQTKIQHVFRAVEWETDIGNVSLAKYDEIALKSIEQELKNSCAKHLKDSIMFDALSSQKVNGKGLFTQRADGNFSLSYTYNDASKTRYCDYIEQRANVLDPTSYHLLHFLRNQKPMWTDTIEFTHASTMDMRKTLLVQRPDVYERLLIDRTRSMNGKKHNIIWASEGKEADASYLATDEVLLKDIQQGVIIPRCLKNRMIQKERTKDNAEVFTPLWIVKRQNDHLDEEIENLEDYTKKTCLEVTCGEGPYIVSRYNLETGETIPLAERQGFLDRKLRRINKEIDDFCDWQWHVEWAFKASYGFEWNGDSLLLARENLLGTYCDYFVDKWTVLPMKSLIETIVEIISYNLFQMDGLKFSIPLLTRMGTESKSQQLSLFDVVEDESVEPVLEEPIPVWIKNWKTNRMERFE